MAKYVDGREAQIGDVVRGRGYNVRHELTGAVVRLAGGFNDNSLVVAHCGAGTRIAPGRTLAGQAAAVVAIAELEYGDAAAFELLVPAGAELKVVRSELGS
jgi:hypothetical protein